MTNGLTDINPSDIVGHIEQNFNRTQATGLNSLIFLALREQTTVVHQRKEWGFEDIPQHIAAWCDELTDDDLLEVATAITTGLLDNLVETGTQVMSDLLDDFAAAALEAKNIQNYAAQAIDDQNKPNLLSDY